MISGFAKQTIIFADDNCGICDMAICEWYEKLMPKLSVLMEYKENIPSKVLLRFNKRVNLFLRHQDQHGLLVHRKYIRCEMTAKNDYVTFPRMVIIGNNSKHQITMSYGAINM